MPKTHKSSLLEEKEIGLTANITIIIMQKKKLIINGLFVLLSYMIHIGVQR